MVHPVEAVHGANRLGHNLLLRVIGALNKKILHITKQFDFKYLAKDHSKGGCAPATLLYLDPKLPLGLVNLLHAGLHQTDQVHGDHNLQAGAVNLSPES